ncbi:probable prolyl 4-hydroxylase 6 isoform X2 [Oryza sativa Japonica Group]|uniref:probable prolyl 4-hydroxylase 6 isoform X2 n=1 Tax=Oryza sativa subsp. japonica TaxID=39947 RepID=UPI00339CE7F0
MRIWCSLVQVKRRRPEEGKRGRRMGSGIGAVLVLVAAWLTFAPPGALASSRRFDLSIAQEKLVNSTGGSTASSSHLVFDPSKSKRLSWHPRIFLYEGFLSDMECDHLVSMVIFVTLLSQLIICICVIEAYLLMFSLSQGRGNMESSLAFTDGDRNSSYNNIEDIVVSKIEDRISLWSFLPKENGESIQVLKYGVNRSGSIKEEPKSSSGAHRLATILMYLSDVKQGGETVFPRSEMKDAQAKEGAPSQCSGYAVRPAKGNAILLFNLRPDGETDKDSQYEECPVLEGEKWLAIKHINLRKFDYPKSSLASEDECTDEDDRCVSWAASGECDRNPVFMIGSSDYYGSCRKSCRVC